MSAPFFLGRIIDVIYTNRTVDYSSSLTRLCLVLSGVFLCGAAANAVRVYLMQTSGKSPRLGERIVPPRRQGKHAGPRFPSLLAPHPAGTDDDGWPGAELCEWSQVQGCLLRSPLTGAEGDSPVCLRGRGLENRPSVRLVFAALFRECLPACPCSRSWLITSPRFCVQARDCHNHARARDT